MKTLRTWLFVPVFLLSAVVAGIAVFFGWMGRRAMPWLRAGTMSHVYYPIATLHRFLTGQPLWQPIDLLIGMQPRTDAHRKVADEDPNVVKGNCVCDNPKCPGRNYGFMPNGKELMSRGNRPREVRPMDDMPPEMKERATALLRGMVGYPELEAKYELAKQQIDAQAAVLEQDKKVIDEMMRLAAADRKVIESDKRLLEKEAEVVAKQQQVIEAQETELLLLKAQLNDYEQKMRAYSSVHHAN